MKVENTRLYLNEKDFLKDIDKLKNKTIYVLKDFEQKFLNLKIGEYKRLREKIKKNNIKIVILK